ncbi:MAG: ABC transporter ATP-binding protein [Candidatus Methanoperedens sp.]|nr:ABC transporter ATP-binding protein [Candidatus Methanoperedens sp.]MCZ7395949.1 ABC transporter ATP-binding protein [Candidatus Methanoperedens sp.]
MFQVSKQRKEEVDAIVIENISKCFKIPHEKKRTVYENIAGLFKGNRYGYEEFWALRNISFSVKRGETIGIIGENGSGKSTLLKVIAGVLYPDSGSVTVNGRIAPFLELGVGFQPELTASENVYLYGSIMGMSRAQIKKRINDIFDFAELEKFRNARLKNFSSGMYARLAFSTAISIEPDIILIDEALAVGDEAFQGKCYDKINEFRREGKTIVFVSHGMETVKQLCERSILLNQGQIGSIGYSEKVVSDYHVNMRIKEESTLKKQHEKKVEQITEKIIIKEVTPHEGIETQQNSVQDRWGSREVEITEVKFFAKNGDETYIFRTGEPLIVRIKYFAKTKIEKPVFGIAIHRNDGVHITGPNTKFHNKVIKSVKGEGIVEYIIDALPLLKGTYLFTAAVYDFACVNPYDHHEKRFTFKVTDGEIKDYGICYIPCRWEYVK